MVLLEADHPPGPGGSRSAASRRLAWPQVEVPSLFTSGSSLRSGLFTSQLLLTNEGITLSSSSLSSSRITGMVSRMSCICSSS